MKKIIVIIYMVLVITVIIMFNHGFDRERVLKEGEFYIPRNVEIYKDTPAYELAKAVKKQNVKKIKKIVSKNPELLNYQDPVYKITLVLWSVGMERYKSLKTLLELGADPNIASENVEIKMDGVVKYKALAESPLFRASGFSYIDIFAKKDAKYVKLLLEYGADPNWMLVENISSSDVEKKMYSNCLTEAYLSFEKVKLLVEAGADINYKFPNGETPTVQILASGVYPSFDKLCILKYLIVDKSADVNMTRYVKLMSGEILENSAVDVLRNWTFELGSKEYAIKLQLIEEFKRQGVDYYATPIPEDILEYIKKEYPATWQEYIKVY